jgi:NAD(P)-dependent dehydrogenase (short-subunit alcohol dehydrogenase family)
MDKPVCVITGGARGIGRAIRNYLEDDYTVVSVGRSTENHVICDLLHEGARRDLLKAIAIYTGNIDVLINNAGFQYYAPAVDYSMSEWYRQLEMLTAYFDLARQAYQHGARRIINVSSTAGIRGTRGAIGYSVAKAGVIHMTKCLSNEWAPRCTVNCLVPGFIETDMLKDAFRDNEHRERVKAYIPAGYFGKPDDFIPVVEFLLRADYVTGAIITVDGGFTGL